MYAVVDTAPATTGVLAFDEIVPLEGREYLFTFQWSDREGIWYVDLGDQDGSPIASGIALLLNVGSARRGLLRRFATDPRIPPGLLFVADMTGVGADIATAGELGERVLLAYLTSDDADLPT